MACGEWEWLIYHKACDCKYHTVNEGMDISEVTDDDGIIAMDLDLSEEQILLAEVKRVIGVMYTNLYFMYILVAFIS